MKISIVTISFNQAQFLRECIDSVAAQKHMDIEHIVVDPGSTDGSREIIDSYGTRLIKVFERDDGPADGLNRGFSRASGEIFGFINADDFLLPQALAPVARQFEQEGSEQFVSGSGYIQRPDNSRQLIEPTKMELIPFLYGACTVFQQGTFFPAAAYRRVGGFNANNRTCWDAELFADLLAAGYVHNVLKDRLAVFRLHPDSISGSGRLEARYNAEQRRILSEKLGRRLRWTDHLRRAYWRARKIAIRTMSR